MDRACSVAGWCEEMRHCGWGCAGLGVEDEALSGSKITDQLLDWPSDERNKGGFCQRPAKPRTRKREGGELGNDAELVCRQLACEGHTDAVEHRVTAAQDRDAPVSAMLGENLIDRGRHGRRPRNP